MGRGTAGRTGGIKAQCFFRAPASPSGPPVPSIVSNALWLRSSRLATLPSAQQINGGAQFEQRVVGGFNAVHARNRVEDDLFLLHFVVRHLRVENYSAETDQRPLLRPVNG